jgi:hypothetical protein
VYLPAVRAIGEIIMEAGFLTESLIVVSEYLNLFQPEHSLLGDTTSENRARYVAM